MCVIRTRTHTHVHARTARQHPDHIEALAHYSIGGRHHVVVAEIGADEIVVVDAECADALAAGSEYLLARGEVWE